MNNDRSRAPPTNRGRDQRRFKRSNDQTYDQQLERGRQRPRTPGNDLNLTTYQQTNYGIVFTIKSH